MMKYSYLLYFCFLLPILTVCGISLIPQQEPVEGIVWDKLIHDFGDVGEGRKYETIFTVTNKRKDTLIIENVQASCGCVAYKWQKTPVIPGSEASIHIWFDTKGKKGVATKDITVYTNKGFFTLTLKAHIIKK